MKNIKLLIILSLSIFIFSSMNVFALDERTDGKNIETYTYILGKDEVPEGDFIKKKPDGSYDETDRFTVWALENSNIDGNSLIWVNGKEYFNFDGIPVPVICVAEDDNGNTTYTQREVSDYFTPEELVEETYQEWVKEKPYRSDGGIYTNRELQNERGGLFEINANYAYDKGAAKDAIFSPSSNSHYYERMKYFENSSDTTTAATWVGNSGINVASPDVQSADNDYINNNKNGILNGYGSTGLELSYQNNYQTVISVQNMIGNPIYADVYDQNGNFVISTKTEIPQHEWGKANIKLPEKDGYYRIVVYEDGCKPVERNIFADRVPPKLETYVNGNLVNNLSSVGPFKIGEKVTIKVVVTDEGSGLWSSGSIPGECFTPLQVFDAEKSSIIYRSEDCIGDPTIYRNNVTKNYTKEISLIVNSSSYTVTGSILDQAGNKSFYQFRILGEGSGDNPQSNVYLLLSDNTKSFSDMNAGIIGEIRSTGSKYDELTAVPTSENLDYKIHTKEYLYRIDVRTYNATVGIKNIDTFKEANYYYETWDYVGVVGLEDDHTNTKTDRYTKKLDDKGQLIGYTHEQKKKHISSVKKSVGTIDDINVKLKFHDVPFSAKYDLTKWQVKASSENLNEILDSGVVDYPTNSSAFPSAQVCKPTKKNGNMSTNYTYTLSTTYDSKKEAEQALNGVTSGEVYNAAKTEYKNKLPSYVETNTAVNYSYSGLNVTNKTKTGSPSPAPIITPTAVTKTTSPNNHHNGKYDGTSGARAWYTNLGVKTGNSNDVLIHTPVVNNSLIKVSNFVNQKVTATNGTALQLDCNFTISFPNLGDHISEKGYNKRDYNWGQGVNHSSFAKKFDVKLPFDAYVGDGYTFVPANTWFSEANIPNAHDYKCVLPVWVKETSYNIETKVVAENCTMESLAQASANTDSQNYVATNNINVEVIGKIYDLRINATNDPGWADVYSASHNRDYIDATELSFGQKGQNKNASYSYAPKLGYTFTYSFKTKGRKSNNVEAFIPENGGFFFVSKTATSNVNPEGVTLFYKKSGTNEYIPVLDNSQIQVNLNANYMEIPQEEKTNSALIYPLEYGSKDMFDVALPYNYNNPVMLKNIRQDSSSNTYLDYLKKAKIEIGSINANSREPLVAYMINLSHNLRMVYDNFAEYLSNANSTNNDLVNSNLLKKVNLVYKGKIIDDNGNEIDVSNNGYVWQYKGVTLQELYGPNNSKQNIIDDVKNKSSVMKLASNGGDGFNATNTDNTSETGEQYVLGSVGHWHAGFRLPTSTVAILSKDVDDILSRQLNGGTIKDKANDIVLRAQQQNKVQTDGYIGVKFKLVSYYKENKPNGSNYPYLNYKGPEVTNILTGEDYGMIYYDEELEELYHTFNGTPTNFSIGPITGDSITLPNGSVVTKDPHFSIGTIKQTVTLSNGKKQDIPVWAVALFEAGLNAGVDVNAGQDY